MVAQKKHLVIVESPGKIRTISKVLGRDFVVKASIGHVRDLPEKKKDDCAAPLVLGVDLRFNPKYVPLSRKKTVIAELRKASANAEIVYLCPDPDREGEAIAWHLKETLDLPAERTFRVTFDEITPRGIRDGFSRRRQIDMDLVNAQQARRILDRIVGYKLSPLLWSKIGSGLSAGRVQSVAVKLIVEREEEIEAFRAEEYWTISAQFQFGGVAFDGDLRQVDGFLVVSSAEDLAKFKQNHIGMSGIQRTLLAKREEAEALAAALRNAGYSVRSFEVKEALDRPYPPFATSQLQQSAANRLGFDARRTMRAAQELYQGVPLGERGPVALITYMRTDSFRISQDALVECRALIEKRFGPQYLPERPNFYASRKGGQDAHECIRPTHPDLTPEDVRAHLTDEQFKLYRLIWERFVACQMRPAVFDAATCDIAAEGEAARKAVFRATGRTLKFDGWLAVLGGPTATGAAHIEASEQDRERGDESGEAPEEKEDKAKDRRRKPGQTLPAMKPGDRPGLKQLDPVQHFTQPPPRYTEATLVKTLEREGIGRPSTYAAILTTIQDRGYVQKLGSGGRGALQPTALGRKVNERLKEFFDHSILDLGFTRLMEAELDKIEEAHLDWKAVLQEFWDRFDGDLTKAHAEMTSTKLEAEPSDVKCPTCGGAMEKRFGRFGYYLRCAQGDACKTTLHLDAEGRVKEKPKPTATGLKCDLCGADVLRSVGRFGAYMHCAKYPKECTFTMRIGKDGHPVRKFRPFPTDLKCEKCKAPLVVRVASRGKNRKPFLSCSKFPKCRVAQDLPPELAEVGRKAMEQWQANDARNRADRETFARTMAGQSPPAPATPAPSGGAAAAPLPDDERENAPPF